VASPPLAVTNSVFHSNFRAVTTHAFFANLSQESQIGKSAGDGIPVWSSSTW